MCVINSPWPPSVNQSDSTWPVSLSFQQRAGWWCQSHCSSSSSPGSARLPVQQQQRLAASRRLWSGRERATVTLMPPSVTHSKSHPQTDSRSGATARSISVPSNRANADSSRAPRVKGGWSLARRAPSNWPSRDSPACSRVVAGSGVGQWAGLVASARRLFAAPGAVREARNLCARPARFSCSFCPPPDSCVIWASPLPLSPTVNCSLERERERERERADRSQSLKERKLGSHCQAWRSHTPVTPCFFSCCSRWSIPFCLPRPDSGRTQRHDLPWHADVPSCFCLFVCLFFRRRLSLGYSQGRPAQA